jgi:hypothetical protein
MSTPAQIPAGWSTLPPGWSASKPGGAALTSPDQENGFQREVDDLTKIEPFNARPGIGGHLLTAAGNIGGGVLSPLGLLAHPEQTLKSLVNTVSNQYGVGGPFADVPSMQEGIARTAVENPAGLAENVAGGLLGGEATGGLLDAARPMLRPLGEGLQNAGGKLIDRTAGSLQKDFAHGAEPGKSYLAGGGKPALSMKSLSSKAAKVASDAGQKLGEVYNAGDAAGTVIPATDAFDAVAEPAHDLRVQSEGFGGTGAPDTLNAYEDRVLPSLASAYSRGGYKPTELWSDAKNLGANTRWNDPTMYDLNAVRQETRGRLGGLLSDAVPDARPLNKIYQGSSNLAERAGLRAQTGSMPLTKLGRIGAEAAIGHATGASLLPLIESVPVASTGAYGLYHIPDAASLGLKALPALFPAGSAASADRDQDQ